MFNISINVQKIKENLGPKPSNFNSTRRIKVDCGVIVSDTENQNVGMKIDLESGEYFWYLDSWIKQRPRK